MTLPSENGQKTASGALIKPLAIGFRISLTIGAASGVLMASIALDNNPQDQFWDFKTGEANVLAVFSVFLSWFIVPQLLFVLFSLIISFAFFLSMKLTPND